MSRYLALSQHLSQLDVDSIRLSFADVELLIGTPLPASAREHQAWWANSRTNDTHLWAHLWIRAGWEKSAVNLAERWVDFRRVEFFDFESQTAREGYEIDRTILARVRNATLADQCRQRDNYTCQVCDFHLRIGPRYVIEVHHCNPLSATGETNTSLDDLVCLCPTCHRVAHLRSTPYNVPEIKEIRGILRDGA